MLEMTSQGSTNDEIAEEHLRLLTSGKAGVVVEPGELSSGR